MFYKHTHFGVWFTVHGGFGEVSDTENSIPTVLSSRTAQRGEAPFNMTVMHSTKAIFYRKEISKAMFIQEDLDFFELQKAVLMDQARSTTLVEVEAKNDTPTAVLVWIKDASTQKKIQRLARIDISANDRAADGTFTILSLFNELNNDIRSVIGDHREQLNISLEKDKALLQMTKNLNKYHEIKERDDVETMAGFGVYVETMALSQAKLQAALDSKTRENIELSDPLPPARKAGDRKLAGLSEVQNDGGDDGMNMRREACKPPANRGKRGRNSAASISLSASSSRHKVQRSGDTAEVAQSQTMTSHGVSLLDDSDDSS